MKYLKIYICLAALLATALGATDAEASHKAWLMKNSGASCVREYPASGDLYPGIIENYENFGVYVTCPVTLAARSGSSSPVSSRKTWLAAKQARIHYKQPNSPFWCQARAVDSSGSVFYSRGRWSAGTGLRTIELIDSEYDWGGSLEAVDQNTFNQLDIECRVGSRNSSNYTPAELLGVDVATCQNAATCTTVRSDSPAGSSWVQGSGTECGTTGLHSVPYLTRGVQGLTNTDTQAWHGAHCPVTTGSDDSYDHSRIIYNAYLYYAGSAAPSCILVSWDQNGNKQYGNWLTPDPLQSNRLRHPGSFNAGLERSLVFECVLAPNSTINGWSVMQSTTRNSGGQ
jgi:hypothetical protein